MLLAINMGNSFIRIGALKNGKLVLSDRISTDLKKTDTEYAVLLHTLLEINHVRADSFNGAILSSVVPTMTNVIRLAIQKAVGKNPIVVGPGVKNGLKIKIENPRTLGSDIVIDAVGATDLYPAPMIVADLGTATTITYIDQQKNYCGGAIMPGLYISSEALVKGTSQLPRVSPDRPEGVIGKNTVDALKSGALFGHASMIDGMIDRIVETEKAENVRIIATGEAAETVIPYCRHRIAIDDNLGFHGLDVIYRKNSSL